MTAQNPPTSKQTNIKTPRRPQATKPQRRNSCPIYTRDKFDEGNNATKVRRERIRRGNTRFTPFGNVTEPGV